MIDKILWSAVLTLVAGFLGAIVGENIERAKQQRKHEQYLVARELAEYRFSKYSGESYLYSFSQEEIARNYYQSRGWAWVNRQPEDEQEKAFLRKCWENLRTGCVEKPREK